MFVLMGSQRTRSRATRELALAYCRIISIHPGSLSSLALPGQPAVLTDFSIVNDAALANFRWEVLRPVADSIQNIELTGNVGLRRFYPAESSSGFALTSTVNLVINGSSLTVFPGVIPNSLAASTTATLVFVNNANECGDCRKFNQAPLVDWTFASPGRDITLNCLANAKGNYVPLGGGNATDLHDNPDCDLSECLFSTAGPIAGSTIPTTAVVTGTNNGVDVNTTGRSLISLTFLFLGLFV